MGLNRREFLRVSATNAAMVMAISMPTVLSAKSKFAGDSNKTKRSHYDTWNVYLTIHPDNQIEIGSPDIAKQVNNQMQYQFVLNNQGQIILQHVAGSIANTAYLPNISAVSMPSNGVITAPDASFNNTIHPDTSVSSNSDDIQSNWDTTRPQLLQISILPESLFLQFQMVHNID